MAPKGTSPPAIRLRRGIRWFIFRQRRLLAALLFSAAAGIAVEASLPQEDPRVAVVVASADLPVGTVLSFDQLSTEKLPQAAVPGRSFTDPAELVGEQLAAPLLRGHVLSDTFLVGTGLLAGAPEGTVAVPVRPADPSTIQLLAAGQRVDVVLSTGNGFEVSTETSVLARGLPVLWIPAGESSGTWPGTGEQEGLVVLAAEPGDAAALAGASSKGEVHLVLRSGGG